MNVKVSTWLAGAAIVCAATTVHAHFPWLIVNEDGKAALFFGENIADRTYKLPPALHDAKVTATAETGPADLALSQLSSDSFVGLVSKSKVRGETKLSTQVTYGIYGGNRLEYYAAHVHGKLPSARSSSVAPKSDSGLTAEVIDTDSGIRLFVTWNGEPMSDVEVHLYCAEGHEEATANTDKDGMVTFSDSEVEAGLNGVMFGFTAEDQGGKLDDKEYKSTMHYCTLTFLDPEDDSVHTQADGAAKPKFDSLPFEITSFGAARVGDMAYVYGGHTGDAHSYSTEEQSDQLLSLDLTNPEAKWTVAATGARLQGLALVANGSRVVLLGGFQARNAAGEEQDLHSLPDVRAFDTKSKTWSDLPPLPSGRSSHDAAVIGDSVYVVGGWTMSGDAETEWQTTALRLNLSDEKSAWEEIAKPPFERRALATVAHNGLLYVIGGMNRAGGPTREVQIYDPESNTWSAGPELVGENGMAGFGAAGWSVGGKLIVSTYEGKVLQLADDGKSWRSLGDSQDSRFFHRLIPLDETRVVSVGGANMEAGKFLDLEVLSIGN